jgi:hypothetical protein
VAKPLVVTSCGSGSSRFCRRWRGDIGIWGASRVPDRQALAGIPFVLRTGIPWEHLPQEMGCGVGHDVLAATARVERSPGMGRLHQVLLLDEPQNAEQLERLRAAVDSSHVRAEAGRNDRPLAGRPPAGGLQAPRDLRGAGRPGRRRCPPATANDITELIPLVDRVPPTGRHGKFQGAARRPHRLQPPSSQGAARARRHRPSPNKAPEAARGWGRKTG